MLLYVPGLLAFLLFSVCLSASEINGKIVDSSGAPVPGAQVSVVGRVGVVAQTTSSASGSFRLDGPETPDNRLVITAPGFSTRTLALGVTPGVNPNQAARVQLEIAPQVDSVQVVGSTLHVAASQQGSSVDIVPREQVRQRNEPYAMDLLRYLPGLTFNQTGAPGGLSSLFLRGGNSNLSLVQVDGVPVNSFGGSFDFAHIPAQAVDHIDVIRGAQSAVYGSYANSGVIDFVTRQPEASPSLDLLAEGGTWRHRRFGLTATGTVAGFGILVSASRIDTDGPVRNGDYRNQAALFNVVRRFARQSLALHDFFDSNQVGQPGPWGWPRSATTSPQTWPIHARTGRSSPRGCGPRAGSSSRRPTRFSKPASFRLMAQPIRRRCRLPWGSS